MANSYFGTMPILKPSQMLLKIIWVQVLEVQACQKRFSCARLPAMIEATSCCISRHGRLRMILCDSALAILWQKHNTSISVRIGQIYILHLAAAIVAALQFYCRRRAAAAIVHCQASLNNHGLGEVLSISNLWYWWIFVLLCPSTPMIHHKRFNCALNWKYNALANWGPAWDIWQRKSPVYKCHFLLTSTP